MENKLEEILQDQGRKKKWLAEKADVSYATIRNLINGSAPSLELAYKIAKALNLTVYDIWPCQK